MTKKLLLLGLLRGQQLHGYGVVEYLQNHSVGAAAIGKSNAYRLLRVLEDDGLIRSASERDGNRPERNVYRVTAAGERFFQQALLAELARDASSEQPGIAVLNYIDAVEPAAAARQLQLRREQVAERHARLAVVPAEVLYLHPAIDLDLRHIEVELSWLDETLARLQQKVLKKNNAAA